MMKLTQRNGITLACGWLLPRHDTALAARVTPGGSATYRSVARVWAGTFPSGFGSTATPGAAINGWVWTGSCAAVSVPSSVPASSPMTFPCPVVTGRPPRRSGNANLVPAAGQHVSLGHRGVSIRRRRHEVVGVGRHLGRDQRVLLGAPALSLRVAADVDRRPPPQVGQREVDPSVATVGRTEQREQRLILV